MSFDPKTLIPVAESLGRAALPTLSTILAGVVPPPFGFLVGPAFTLIANALGQDPATATPASIQATIDANPAGAAVALQPVEDHYTYLQAQLDAAQADLETHMHDVQNARDAERDYAKEGSPIQWGAPLISALAVINFGVAIVLVLWFKMPDSGPAQMLLGALIAGYGTVLNYWLGSSKGSADKTNALVSAIKSPPSAAHR